MKFKVQSGKYSESIEAVDFNHAANIFLSKLMENETNLKLGGVISVSAEITESFILTNDALKSLVGVEKLKLCLSE